MSRKIFLEMEIDWEDYEDISDDFLVIDAFENYQPKDGVTIKISDALAERDKLIDEMISAFKHGGYHKTADTFRSRAEAMRGGKG